MISRDMFQEYTLIVVFDKTQKKVLLCKRKKNPYKGLYNFVGGRMEEGEESVFAAYRELYEETGISSDMIELSRIMDISYYNSQSNIHIYVGVLTQDVKLIRELNELQWFDIETNFFDLMTFAGCGNVGHILSHALMHGYGVKKEKNIGIGIDGCKEGWVVARVQERRLILEKCKDMEEIAVKFSNADEILIDMVVGLPESMGDIRPDSFARRILEGKSMAIFAVPCRQAIYAEDEESMISLNKKILDKGLGRQTIAIIPKMREVDTFLANHRSYISRIKESHPEVCFSRLYGKTVMTNKTKLDGMEQRIEILKDYIDNLSIEEIRERAKKLRCSASDILDAACLAVTANMALEDKIQIIPEMPMNDHRGIPMRMVIPKEKESI